MKGMCPLCLRKLTPPLPPPPPPSPPHPSTQVVYPANRKGRQGACFHTFHSQLPPCTCSSPPSSVLPTPSPNHTPLHSVSKPFITSLCGFKKALL